MRLTLLCMLCVLSSCSAISNTWNGTKTALGFTGKQDLGPRHRPIGNPGGEIGMAQDLGNANNTRTVFPSPFVGGTGGPANALPQMSAPTQAMQNPTPNIPAYATPSAPYAGYGNNPNVPAIATPSFGNNAAMDPYANNPTMMYGNANNGTNAANLPNTYTNSGNGGFGQMFQQPSNSAYGNIQMPTSNNGYGNNFGGMNNNQLQQQGSQFFQGALPQQNSQGNYNPLMRHHSEPRFTPLSNEQTLTVTDENDPFNESEATRRDTLPDLGKNEKGWYQFPNLGTIPPTPKKPNARSMHQEFNALINQRDQAETNQARTLNGEDTITVLPALTEDKTPHTESPIITHAPLKPLEKHTPLVEERTPPPPPISAPTAPHIAAPSVPAPAAPKAPTAPSSPTLSPTNAPQYNIPIPLR